MNLIDMHCDTLMVLLDAEEKRDLSSEQCHINISGMRKAGTLVQFFACFTWLNKNAEQEGYEQCWKRANRMIDCMEEQVQKFPNDLAQVYSYQDIMKNSMSGKISALLTVEEGGIINGKMERLEYLYDRGIRLVTPTWNFENCLGYPNSKDPSVMEKGLKPFGIDVIKRMGELGMIADVSHLSDGGFWDVLQYATGPVVASHSNCRTLCNHTRNLTDEMIRALSNKGGVAGINVYGGFLNGTNDSKISDMTEHISHMINVGGSEFPAIGTDFDGIPPTDVLEVNGVAEMEKLWDALKKKGISEAQLDKIWCGNVLRILSMI